MKDYAMNSLQGSVPNMAAYDVYSAFGTDSDDSGEVFSTETVFHYHFLFFHVSDLI